MIMTLLYIQEKDKTMVIKTEQKEAVEYIKRTRRKNAGILGTPSFEDLNFVYAELAPFEYYESMEDFLKMEKDMLTNEEEISFIPFEYAHYTMAQLVDIIQHLKMVNKYKDDEIVRLNEKLRGRESIKKIKIIKIDSEDN